MPLSLRSSAALLVAVLLAGLSGTACAAQDYTVTREEVTFESRGTTLAGTLWLPEKRGPHPTIIAVHGSGRTTRNDHYQQQTAEHFSKRGVAVLTFDKRGTGRSEGTYPGSYSSSMVIYAMDVLAAVAHLKTRSGIDGAQIGLWGISQAGWIIPIAAAVSRGDIAFTIIVSGPTVSIAEENYYSELTGEDGPGPTGLSREEISRRLKTLAPAGLDASAFIAEMTMPALWLYGDLDKSVPVDEGIADLQAIKAEWNRDFTWQVFPGANHGLKAARTGGSWERPRPTKTVAGYFEAMDAWLFGHAGVRVP